MTLTVILLATTLFCPLWFPITWSFFGANGRMWSDCFIESGSDLTSALQNAESDKINLAANVLLLKGGEYSILNEMDDLNSVVEYGDEEDEQDEAKHAEANQDGKSAPRQLGRWSSNISMLSLMFPISEQLS